MSAFFRRRVEATIERMIDVLDQIDGDPDFEPDPVEEQHDAEPDNRPLVAPLRFVIAKVAQKRS